MSELNCQSEVLIDGIEAHKDVNHVLIQDRDGRCQVLLKKGTTENDILQAYIHSVYFQQALSQGRPQTAETIQETLHKTTDMFPSFL